MLKFISSAAVAALVSLGSQAHAAESMLTSWYGSYFHGRTTANGETYNMYGNTAAHKTLPFNTKLLVCYEGCAVVRVNDRGPYIGTRELDLSYGAAEQIGLLWPGVAYTMVTPI